MFQKSKSIVRKIRDPKIRKNYEFLTVHFLHL